MQLLTGICSVTSDPEVHHPARRRGGALPLGPLPRLAQDMGRPPLQELLLDNVFFDTCVYHQPGMELLLKVIPRTTFCSPRRWWARVRGIDPETGTTSTIPNAISIRSTG